jgi:hypothetical protein
MIYARFSDPVPGAMPTSLPKFHFARCFTPKALYYKAQGQRTT